MPSWSTTIPTVRTLALMASLLWYHRCPTSGGSAARQSRESSLNYPVSQPTQRGEAFGRTRHQRPTNRDQGNWKSRCWRQQQPHERPLHPACVAESVNIPAEVLVTLMATSSPLGTWEEGTQLEHGVSCRASAAVEKDVFAIPPHQITDASPHVSGAAERVVQQPELKMARSCPRPFPSSEGLPGRVREDETSKRNCSDGRPRGAECHGASCKLDSESFAPRSSLDSFVARAGPPDQALVLGPCHVGFCAQRDVTSCWNPR